MTPATGTLTSPWLVRPPGTRPARLFCFPFSGAGASAFSAWPDTIGDIDICPVQLPGRENRLAEAHYGTFEDLADALADTLPPLLDRPFAFFAHCAGALPAYETVLRLQQRGLPVPECLIVSAQPAPHETARDRMLTLTEPELRTELETFLTGRGIQPRPDMIEVGLSVLLRDHAAASAYRRTETAPLPCRLVAVHWREDPEVALEDLQGWRAYTDAAEFRTVTGGHYDVMDASDELRALLTCWR